MDEKPEAHWISNRAKNSNYNTLFHWTYERKKTLNQQPQLIIKFIKKNNQRENQSATELFRPCL